MTENRLYGALLLALLVAAYLSWHQDDEAPADTAVALLNERPQDLQRIELRAKTATVVVTYREDEAGARYPWFEVERNGQTKAFVANEAFEKAEKTYAKFEALRSLGKLDGDTLKQTELQTPARTLTITTAKGSDTFEIGAQTPGARDYYVRQAGQAEVFLVKGNVVSDLEFPASRFTQFKLRNTGLDKVKHIRIRAGDKVTEGIHQNPMSPSDAYWAFTEKPDKVAQTLGNYIAKVEQLSALEYVSDREQFDTAAPVFELIWTGEGGGEVGKVDLRRRTVDGGTGKPEYLARSPVSRVPVKVLTSLGEQLEADLALLFEGD